LAEGRGDRRAKEPRLRRRALSSRRLRQMGVAMAGPKGFL
jgi:hypothetical protein